MLFRLIRIVLSALLFWLAIIPPPQALAADIAILMAEDTSQSADVITGITSELGGAHNLKEFRLSQDDSNSRDVIRQMLSAQPALVFTVGSRAALLARELVRDTPVVFTLAVDNPTFGLFSSNMTGVNAVLPADLRFTLLRNFDSNLRRVGVVYNPANTGYLVNEAMSVAGPLGIEIVPAKVDVKQDIPRATRALSGRIDMIWMLQDPVMSDPEALREMLKFSLLENLPMLTFSHTIVQAGALFSLTPSEGKMGQQAARIAKEILAGKRPGQIPVQQPQGVEIGLNLRTAKRIGRLEDLAINILVYAAEEKQKIQVFR